MDLCAEMLAANLQTAVPASRICPPLKRRFSGLPYLGRHRAAGNADRFLNRFWDYPRLLRKLQGVFDLFHVVDHSYAQLVHALPASRTGIFCHDLDAFRCLLEPAQEPRPRWFKAAARHMLRGLQKAAVVFHSTTAVRCQIERYGLLDPARLVCAPYGPAPEFIPEPGEADAAARALAGVGCSPFLLHVGRCMPRKRLDVLLDLFAAVQSRHPDLRLVQIGGKWTTTLRNQIERLKIGSQLVQCSGVSRSVLAALYRQAALVLVTSEAEGFGLPVLEALACGSRVVASDLPALREVGGEALVYCPVADVPHWVETVGRLLAAPDGSLDRVTRLRQAARFSWATHARTILEAYQRLR